MIMAIEQMDEYMLPVGVYILLPPETVSHAKRGCDGMQTPTAFHLLTNLL